MKDLPAQGFQELLKRQRQCSYRSLDPWCWWLPPFPFQIIFDGGVLPKLMSFFRVSFTLVSETDQWLCFEGYTSSPSAWTMFLLCFVHLILVKRHLQLCDGFAGHKWGLEQRWKHESTVLRLLSNPRYVSGRLLSNPSKDGSINCFTESTCLSQTTLGKKKPLGKL